MKRIKRVAKPSFAFYENSICEIAHINDQLKLLETRKKDLQDKVNEFMETLPSDSKGHKVFSVIDSDGKEIKYTRQRRQKITLNISRAIKFLKAKGLKYAIVKKEIVSPEVTQDQVVEALLSSGFDSYIDTVEEPDEATIAQLVSDGILTTDDMEEICDIQETFATIVKKGE